MTQKRTHTLSLLAAITAAVIFGMSFMFSKLALEKAAPTVLLAVRFTVAVAAMTLVILVNALVGKLRGRPLFAFSLRGKPVYQLLLLGIVQPVAYFIFENYGILYTSSAVAGTIISAVPVCCILMDVLVLHEKVTRRQVLCAVGAVGGVALISAGGAVMVSALGMLFLLLTMLSDTLYYGISHSAAKVFTPFEMTYVMFLVGMAAFIPAALFQTGGLHSELITVPAQSGQFWLAVVYLGVLSSGVAYGLLNFANSHLTVSESSLFSNVTTVVSVLAGVILLKEPFSLWQILGVAVILDEGKIAGIVTDGDVRRAMLKYGARFFDITADEIMTRTPKTVSVADRLTDAEQLMQDNKIHSLIVVDRDGKLAGIVELYDLMRSGK